MNHTVENQSDCMDHLWFQNGYYKYVDDEDYTYDDDDDDDDVDD